MASNCSIGVRPLLMKTYPEYKSNSTLADAFYILKLIKKQQQQQTLIGKNCIERNLWIFLLYRGLKLSFISWSIFMDICTMYYVRMILLMLLGKREKNRSIFIELARSAEQAELISCFQYLIWIIDVFLCEQWAFRTNHIRHQPNKTKYQTYETRSVVT